MDKKRENSPKMKSKVRLTREELLAGKVSSASESPDSLLDDPLFHSPDDFLTKAHKPVEPKPAKTPKNKEEKQGPLPRILKEESQFLDGHLNTQYSKPRIKGKPLPVSGPPKTEEEKKNSRSDLIMKSVTEMKYRHEKEITRWKLYEQQVNSWKDRVLMIVGQLKKELLKTKTEIKEVDTLKELIHEKDEEIKKLKNHQSRKKHK